VHPTRVIRQSTARKPEEERSWLLFPSRTDVKFFLCNVEVLFPCPFVKQHYDVDPNASNAGWIRNKATSAAFVETSRALPVTPTGKSGRNVRCEWLT
jgi:hypothetical protein